MPPAERKSPAAMLAAMTWDDARSRNMVSLELVDWSSV